MKRPLTESETLVLGILFDHYYSDSNCLYSRYIAKLCNLTMLQARRAIKSLERRGYVELIRGIFDSDGAIVGSGYCCTSLGRDVWSSIPREASRD
ncbi:helix-turn-helix domain-containing protein [Bradyrhizobium liaoningense]